jgi:hypothetical protein
MAALFYACHVLSSLDFWVRQLPVLGDVGVLPKGLQEPQLPGPPWKMLPLGTYAEGRAGQTIWINSYIKFPSYCIDFGLNP